MRAAAVADQARRLDVAVRGNGNSVARLDFGGGDLGDVGARRRSTVCAQKVRRGVELEVEVIGVAGVSAETAAAV